MVILRRGLKLLLKTETQRQLTSYSLWVLLIVLSSQLISCCRLQTIPEDFALLQNSGDISSRMSRGEMRAECGNRQGAVSDFTYVINLNLRESKAYGNIADAYFNRGQQYRILGNNDQALLDYRESANLYKQWNEEENYRAVIQEIKYLQKVTIQGR